MTGKAFPILQTINLSKTFKKNDRTFIALEEINLTVDQGDIFGIIGLSGAGKSTLIRSIACLLKPTKGEIQFHQNNIVALKGQELRNYRKKIGMIFQHFNLLNSRNAADNIAYPLEIANFPKDAIKKRVEELLKLVGLYEKRNNHPFELSGGEKQRVGIARALARYPEILLCDEATSALDPKTTREILSLLKDINKKTGITILLITHQMEVIKQICNKIAVLEKGKIVEMGLTPDIFFHPAHPTTRKFLQISSHDLPEKFLNDSSPDKKLVLLRFKGEAASEPIISEMVKNFDIKANILLGWIDNIQMRFIGTLIIELAGPFERIEKALDYLKKKNVHWESLKNEQS